LPSNYKTQLERVTKGKPSSLFGLVVNNEAKKSFLTFPPAELVARSRRLLPGPDPFSGEVDDGHPVRRQAESTVESGRVGANLAKLFSPLTQREKLERFSLTSSFRLVLRL
jgi:hypothetical protein